MTKSERRRKLAEIARRKHCHRIIAATTVVALGGIIGVVFGEHYFGLGIEVVGLYLVALI